MQQDAHPRVAALPHRRRRRRSMRSSSSVGPRWGGGGSGLRPGPIARSRAAARRPGRRRRSRWAQPSPGRRAGRVACPGVGAVVERDELRQRVGPADPAASSRRSSCMTRSSVGARAGSGEDASRPARRPPSPPARRDARLAQVHAQQAAGSAAARSRMSSPERVGRRGERNRRVRVEALERRRGRSAARCPVVDRCPPSAPASARVERSAQRREPRLPAAGPPRRAGRPRELALEAAMPPRALEPADRARPAATREPPRRREGLAVLGVGPLRDHAGPPCRQRAATPSSARGGRPSWRSMPPDHALRHRLTAQVSSRDEQGAPAKRARGRRHRPAGRRAPRRASGWSSRGRVLVARALRRARALLPGRAGRRRSASCPPRSTRLDSARARERAPGRT